MYWQWQGLSYLTPFVVKVVSYVSEYVIGWLFFIDYRIVKKMTDSSHTVFVVSTYVTYTQTHGRTSRRRQVKAVLKLKRIRETAFHHFFLRRNGIPKFFVHFLSGTSFRQFFGMWLIGSLLDGFEAYAIAKIIPAVYHTCNDCSDLRRPTPSPTPHPQRMQCIAFRLKKEEKENNQISQGTTLRQNRMADICYRKLAIIIIIESLLGRCLACCGRSCRPLMSSVSSPSLSPLSPALSNSPGLSQKQSLNCYIYIYIYISGDTNQLPYCSVIGGKYIMQNI